MSDSYKREELITAIRQGRLSSDQIGELPEDERSFAILLRDFDFAGEDHLFDAPETVIRKAESLLDTRVASGRPKSLLAKLVFDSWAMPLPAGVRGSATADDRRMRFDLEPFVFDLRVEKQGRTYHCIAEIAGPEDTADRFTVTVDNRKIKAGDEGLFEWSSSKPPRRMAVAIDNEPPVELPELSWDH